MNTTTDYEEFLKSANQMQKDINTAMCGFVLIKERLDDNLLEPDQKSKNYIQSVSSAISGIQASTQIITRLGIQAYNQIQNNFEKVNNNIENINDNIEDVKKSVKNTIDSLQGQNDDQFQYTQQLIEELTTTIREQHEQLQQQSQIISKLYECMKPPRITKDHVENAKILIDTVKNNQGKPIKSASITIQNVQSILEAYDRLKGLSILTDEQAASSSKSSTKSSKYSRK